MNIHLHPEALFIVQAFILITLPFTIWSLPKVKRYIPLVVVQIVLGVTLGPSIMGRFAPDIFHSLFPNESLPILNGLAWKALILFGFLTGLHFDLKEIAGKGKSFLIISCATILVPALLGGLAAFGVADPIFFGEHADLTTFVLGMAIAVGVTALPVLGAILVELNLIEKDLGKRTLGYATVNDLLLWVLVSILIALAQADKVEGSHSSSGYGKVVQTIVLTVLFLVFMYKLVRPYLEKLVKRNVFTEHPDNKQLVIIFSGVFLSALATELIGIHYLLGAFIFGAMVPKTISQGIHHALEKFVGVALLPFFFMLTGLKTTFEISNSNVWILFGIMTVIASLGKIIGTAIPERYIAHHSWHESLRAGMLMQTKGLMEVVVLNIMLTGGIISSVAFSAMLFMAVVTTAFTKPSLLLVDGIRYFKPTDSEGALHYDEHLAEPKNKKRSH